MRLIIAILFFVSSVVQAENHPKTHFFSLGTASTAGSYFAIGSMIASVLSKPPHSRDCEKGGSCGVEGLVTVAVSTDGSLENIELLKSGDIQMAIVQSDIAYWAFSGQQMFNEKDPFLNLRAIGSLYQENMHIVVRKDSDIKTIDDIRGKTIAMDSQKSGSRPSAQIILDNLGVKSSDYAMVNLNLAQSLNALKSGDIDVLFYLAGAPSSSLYAFSKDQDIRLIDIPTTLVKTLQKQWPFVTQDTIPDQSYGDHGDVQTMSLPAVLVTSSDISMDLISNITTSLWHDKNLEILKNGHDIGHKIKVENALDGIGIPLHDGAMMFYETSQDINTVSPTLSD